MFREYHVRTSKELIKFCCEYVDSHLYDRSYSNEDLLEYYPNVNLFSSNLKIESISIGKLPKGTLELHVDDGRESALIIPINSTQITMLFEKQSIKFNSSFLIDTTITHGVDTSPNTIFIAIDFKKSFNEACIELSSMHGLELGLK